MPRFPRIITNKMRADNEKVAKAFYGFKMRDYQNKIDKLSSKVKNKSSKTKDKMSILADKIMFKNRS